MTDDGTTRAREIAADVAYDGGVRTLLLGALISLAISPGAVARAECPIANEGVFVEDARLRVIAPIGFDLYAPALDPASYAAIDAVARRMIACPDLRIEVQVHTDTRRTEAFNARASAAIAALIRDRLIARGVPGDRVAACGYGESRPVTEGGRAPYDPANTRVEWVRVPDARAHRCPAIGG